MVVYTKGIHNNFSDALVHTQAKCFSSKNVLIYTQITFTSFPKVQVYTQAINSKL